VAVSLFVEKGFDRTTTRELSKALGWSTGRVYQYIETKDDLIRLLVDFANRTNYEVGVTIDRMIEGLDPIEAVKVVMRLRLTSADRNQDLYKCMGHLMLNLDFDTRHKLFKGSRAMKDHFEKVIKSGVETGDFKTDNIEVAAFNMFHTTIWATRRWLFNRHYSLEEYIEEQTENILKQLGVSKYYGKAKCEVQTINTPMREISNKQEP